MLDTVVTVLGSVDSIEVVGAAGAGEPLLEMIDRTRPDVVVMDLRLGDEWGFDLVPSIHDAVSRPYVVVFSATVDAGTERECARLGVFRQVQKGTSIDVLRDAVLAAAAARRPDRG